MTSRDTVGIAQATGRMVEEAQKCGDVLYGVTELGEAFHQRGITA